MVLGAWQEAEVAGQRRHVARRGANLQAAAEFSRQKIAAIQRAISIAPQYFHADWDYVNGVRLFSVLCRMNGRSLHVPTWVQLPDVIFRSEVSTMPA
jgi:hypothetical protein